MACGAFDGEMEELKCHHGYKFSDSCISANCDAINHGPTKARYKLKPTPPPAQAAEERARAATDLLREYLRYSDGGCIEYGRSDDLSDRAKEFVEGA
jgi:hypothetical protein